MHSFQLLYSAFCPIQPIVSGVDRLLHVLHFNVFLPIDSRDLRVSNIYLVEEPLLQEDILIVGDFAVASVMCDTRTCTRRSNSMYNLMLNQEWGRSHADFR